MNGFEMAVPNVRSCSCCGLEKPRVAFSNRQWKNFNTLRGSACAKCINAKQLKSPSNTATAGSKRKAAELSSLATIVQKPATDRIQLTLPATYPAPSDEQEQLLLTSVLLPNVRLQESRKTVAADLCGVPLQWDDLSIRRQTEISTMCASLGIHVKQAMGLRRAAYKSATPWKFEGNEAKTLAAGEAFEADVQAFLSARGILFQTQQQQAAAWASSDSKGCLGPTPDFIICSPLSINGSPVKWIEVKSFYGAGIVSSIKDWMPHIKISKQIDKYISTFGPHGAVILRYGYSEGLRRRIPLHVQLLDGGVLS